jgi:hypothetical protein
MTGEYTCVSPERQNELARRIQRQLRCAARKNGQNKIVPLPVSISGARAVEKVMSLNGNRTINKHPGIVLIWRGRRVHDYTARAPSTIHNRRMEDCMFRRLYMS